MEKNVLKNLIYLSIFLIWLLGFALPNTIIAVDPTYADQPNYKLQVPIFGLTEATCINAYIKALYQYALVLIVPLVIIVIIIAGLFWIFSSGVYPGKIETAKQIIYNSLIGLLIVMLSYAFFDLLNLTVLKCPQVSKIYIREGGGNTILVNGQPQLVTTTSPLDAACPTQGSTQAQVRFTNYYKPNYGDPGLYKNKPWTDDEKWRCNIAMQCSCPGDKDMSFLCGTYNRKPLHACASFGPDVPYCTEMANGRKPVANHSVAADLDIPRQGGGFLKCFKSGCQFTIQNDNSGTTYSMEDTGDAIAGSHLDFFAGGGNQPGDQPLATNIPQGERTINLDPASCY